MKIIAITSGQSQAPSQQAFLVEMNADEIAKIQGYPSNANAPTNPYIGAKFDVGRAWSDLARFRAAKENIEKAAETLRACAQLSVTAAAAYVIEPPPPEPLPQ